MGSLFPLLLELLPQAPVDAGLDVLAADGARGGEAGGGVCGGAVEGGV